MAERSHPPRRDPGRFSLLLVDNETGAATGVDVWPMRVDVLIRPTRRSTRLVGGWLLMQLQEAAVRLYPEFIPIPTEMDKPPFRPRWRRRLADIHYVEDDDGGI